MIKEPKSVPQPQPCFLLADQGFSLAVHQQPRPPLGPLLQMMLEALA